MTLDDWRDTLSMSAQGLGPSDVGRMLGVSRQAAHQSVRIARTNITRVAMVACARAGVVNSDSFCVSNVRKNVIGSS